MKFFKQMLSEDNGNYSATRLIALLLVATGIIILIYALLNKMVDYMVYGASTAGAGAGLKAGSKLTEK